MNNIYQRMSAITVELQTVAKNLEVTYGKSSYKAVSETDVLRAVKPVEAKYGVYSYPVSREIVESEMYDNNGRATFRMRVKTVYRFINMDKPDEFIDIVSYGDGLDTADKAPGKALTYADKYALLKAYKINTGDDPDAIHSGELEVKSVEDVKATAGQLQAIKEAIGNDADRMAKLLAYYKVEKLEDLNVKQASQAAKQVQKK